MTTSDCCSLTSWIFLTLFFTVSAREGAEAIPIENEQESRASATEKTGKVESAQEMRIEPARIHGKHWPIVSDVMRRRVEAAIAHLADNSYERRMWARAELLSFRSVAVPILVENLYHQDSRVRTHCAVILGKFRAREAIKYLIEVFYSAMPVSGQATAYQRTFVRALEGSLGQTTGEYFISVEARSPLIQEGLRSYIDWYTSNSDRLPKQVGEPEIDPLDLLYLEKIKICRSLVLDKRYWVRPPLSVTHATGYESVIDGEVFELERPADRLFLNRWPLIHRQTGSESFREGDKEWADRLMRIETRP